MSFCPKAEFGGTFLGIGEKITVDFVEHGLSTDWIYQKWVYQRTVFWYQKSDRERDFELDGLLQGAA